MPRETDRTRPALALSGGGFRATLFHCGALLRLNELGWLPKLERIASVSGGSIAAARLAVQWDDLSFDGQGRAENLMPLVIEPLRSFCRRNVDVLTIGFGAVRPGKSIGDRLADTYEKHLTEGKSLQDLPDFPQFVFKATNLQTGRMVRLSKRRLADYLLGEIANPVVRVAVAVAASSAFPPVLSPVEVRTQPDDWVALEGALLHGKRAYNRKLLLTDGGAYDNIGLETIDDFDVMLVSDAGAPFAMQVDRGTLWHKQVLRALDIATDQSRGLRKRLMFAEVATAEGRKAAYWGIDQDGVKNAAPGGLPCPPEVTGKIAKIRTRLDRFSAKEQGQLINWGYAACDNAMRRFAATDAPAPTAWPVPKYALG